MTTIDDRKGMWSRLSLFGAFVAAALGLIALLDTCGQEEETEHTSPMGSFCCIGKDRIPLKAPLLLGAACKGPKATGQACK